MQALAFRNILNQNNITTQKTITFSYYIVKTYILITKNLKHLKMYTIESVALYWYLTFMYF